MSLQLMQISDNYKIKKDQMLTNVRPAEFEDGVMLFLFRGTKYISEFVFGIIWNRMEH